MTKISYFLATIWNSVAKLRAYLLLNVYLAFKMLKVPCTILVLKMALKFRQRERN